MPIVGSSIISSNKVVTFEVFNVTATNANTEYSQVISGNSVGYMIRARGCAELKVTHTATESGTKYVTVPKGSTLTDEHLFSNLTLYFQSPTAGTVIEIVAWKV